jgi:hypothetical protein
MEIVDELSPTLTVDRDGKTPGKTPIAATMLPSAVRVNVSERVE